MSTGWSLTDAPDGNADPIVRRKTLRLEFSRIGDPALVDARQIKYEGANWVYRGSKLKVPGLPADKTPPMSTNGRKSGKPPDADKEQQSLLPPPPPHAPQD